MVIKKPRIDVCADQDLDYKKIVEYKLIEIQCLVKHSLNAKKRDIREAKLAFSTVDQENYKLKVDNEWQRSQLDDCIGRIKDAAELHKERLEEIENQNKVEKKGLIFEYENALESLRIKTNELDLDILEEKSRRANLKNSFLVANFVMENMVLEETEKNFSLEFALEEKTNELNNLQEKLKEKEWEIEKKRVIIQNLEMANVNIENKLFTRIQELENMIAENKEKEEALVKSDNERTDLPIKFENMDEQLKERSVNVNNLEKTVISLQSVIDNLTKERACIAEERQEEKQLFECQIKVKCQEKEIVEEDNISLIAELNEKQHVLELQKYIVDTEEETKISHFARGGNDVAKQNMLYFWAWGNYEIVDTQLVFQYDDSGGIKCPACSSRMAPRTDTVKKHFRRSHKDIELDIPDIRIKCPACKKLQSSSHMLRHLLKCTMNNDPVSDKKHHFFQSRGKAIRNQLKVH